MVQESKRLDQRMMSYDKKEVTDLRTKGFPNAPNNAQSVPTAQSPPNLVSRVFRS